MSHTPLGAVPRRRVDDRLDVDGYGSRLRIRRPVGWPRMSTWGFSIARSSRSVIC